MLKIIVQPLMALKGIKSPMAFLQEHGFPYYTARHIVEGHLGSFNLRNIEKLCIALECTPNDITFYKQGNTVLPEAHPLHTLNMERFRDEINEGLQQLDAAEVALVKEQVRAILERKKG